MSDEEQAGRDDNGAFEDEADVAEKSAAVDELEDDAAIRAALLASRRFARKQRRQQELELVKEENKRHGPISLKRSWGRSSDQQELVKKKRDEEALQSPSTSSAQPVPASAKTRSDGEKWPDDKTGRLNHRTSDRKERRSDTRSRTDHLHSHRKGEHKHDQTSQRESGIKREEDMPANVSPREQRILRVEQQQHQHRCDKDDEKELVDAEEIVNFFGTGETYITLSSATSSFQEDTNAHSEHDSAAETSDVQAAENESREEQGEYDSNGGEQHASGEGDRSQVSRSPDSPTAEECSSVTQQLPVYCPAVMGCRSVDEFHCLNRIEEGTYGVVYRAMEKRTGEVVALKRLKMEKEKDGFPITSLREVNMLLKSRSHRNIVNVREIVVGSNMDKIYLVMEYVEHDLKTLMDSMKQPFLVGEVKTLMHQLLSGIHHLHDNWILHRDLKTSNLLLSHRGILKIGDFGLAREYGSPLKPYTPVVVTLWYRAPELLLGVKEYSTAIDLWSVGCIFAELLTLKPLFPGRTEVEQLTRFCKMLGTPNENIWPGFNDLPVPKRTQLVECPFNHLRKHFGATLSDRGFQLLSGFLTYNPKARISALEASMHSWFVEEPRPVHPSLFPTWPAKSELVKVSSADRNVKLESEGDASKPAPRETEKDLLNTLRIRPHQSRSAGFTLKFDAVKF